MKSQLLCFLFVAFVATSFGMVFNCADPNSCDKCPPMPEDCQNIVKCGCCDICKDTLKEGESCVMSIVLTTFYQKQCAPDLMCDQETMKCLPKAVVMAKMFPKDENAVISQRHIPDSVGCNGSVCFCAFEGKQLEGYKLLKQEHITQHSCNCAFVKEHHRMRKLLGRIFFCNNHGGYEEKQCIGSSCYCVNEAGERLLGENFSISDIESHIC